MSTRSHAAENGVKILGLVHLSATTRIQNREILAEHLLGGIAEELLGRGIPTGDDAVKSAGDDGLARGLDDGRQPGNHLLGFQLSIVETLALQSLFDRGAQPAETIFDDVIRGAALHHLHRALLADSSRNDDEGDGQPALLDYLKGAQ